MPEGLVVREIDPGIPENAETVARLRYDALYREWGLPRSLSEDTDGRSYRHIAVFDGHRMVGYARLHLETAEPQISQVAVARDRRGEGIGALLVETLVEMARQEGRAEVFLDARVHVIGFYERLGFEVVGEEFLSKRTGTPHRRMRLAVCCG